MKCKMIIAVICLVSGTLALSLICTEQPIPKQVKVKRLTATQYALQLLPKARDEKGIGASEVGYEGTFVNTLHREMETHRLPGRPIRLVGFYERVHRDSGGKEVYDEAAEFTVKIPAWCPDNIEIESRMKEMKQVLPSGDEALVIGAFPTTGSKRWEDDFTQCHAVTYSVYDRESEQTRADTVTTCKTMVSKEHWRKLLEAMLQEREEESSSTSVVSVQPENRDAHSSE